MKKSLVVMMLVVALVFSAFANGSSESKESGKALGGELVIYSPNSDALVDAAYTFGELYGVDV